MAYRKRTYKRKRMFRKKGSRSLKRVVKNVIDRTIEMKFRQFPHTLCGKSPVSPYGDVDFSSSSYGSSSSVSSLCAAIQNGTGEGQRIGNRVTLRGLQVNFAVQPGDNTNYYRFCIVSPKKEYDNSSVANLIQQIFSNQGSSGTQYLSPIDTDVFKVYYDRRFYMTFKPLDGSTATTIPSTRFIKKFIKFRKAIKWQISAPILPTTDVFLVALSDSALSPNAGIVSGFCKIWFQDA